MRVLLLEPKSSDHNYTYLASLVSDLRVYHEMVFGYDESLINDFNYLNQFDLVITSCSFHGRFKGRTEYLKPIILSVNHSLLGPSFFNDYQSRVLHKLNNQIASRIRFLVPEFFSTIHGYKEIDFPDQLIMTNKSYRFIYHLKNPWDPSIIESSLTTYFNHWTTSRDNVSNILESIRDSENPVIRLHPCYYNFIDNNYNPIRRVKGWNDSDYYDFLKFINSSGIKISNKMDIRTNMDLSKVSIFDGSSGTLPELLIRKSLFNPRGSVHMIPQNIFETPTHDSSNLIPATNLFNRYGKTDEFNNSVILLDEDISSKIRLDFDIPKSINEVNSYYVDLITELGKMKLE